MRIGTWNLENLFRPADGSDTPTGTAAYEAKLASLARVIDGLALDVLAVQEVGSAGALDDLVARLAGTWHPRTRPDDVTPDPGTSWLGLEVLRTVDGGPGDDSGVVEFVARFRGPRGEESLHETSRFERRGGRWVYVDGDVR